MQRKPQIVYYESPSAAFSKTNKIEGDLAAKHDLLILADVSAVERLIHGTTRRKYIKAVIYKREG